MLLHFYGEECPHCIRIKPFVERLRKDGVKLETHEVWHHPDNLEKMKELDKGRCGAIPYFIDTETGKYTCGETTYEELIALSKGK